MANEWPRNGDVRAILALSQAEALTGARRSLKLPGGRKIVVPVPAGTHDGQVIRLEGLGRPSLSGARGALILTVSLATAEQPQSRLSAPPASSFNDQSTELTRTSTPYLSHRQSPINVDTTYPAHASPHRDTAIPKKRAPSPPRRSRSYTSRIILTIILVLFVIGASAALLYTNIIQPGQLRAQANATTAAKTAGITQAYAKSTAKAEATARTRNSATATVQTRSFAHATATAASQQALFTQATSATPSLNDPLNQQNGNRWEEDSKAGGGSCAFTNGAYRTSMPQIGFFASCYDLSNNYSNFVFQVQMTILKGDRGGIIFRSGNFNHNFYLFRASQDGSYDLFLYVDNNGSNSESLAQGSSPAIHRGLNQPNKIAVVARGSSLSFYINQQYVTNVDDTTYKTGSIGVFADDQFNPTEVAFNNAEVWIL
jgi:hypothetical protein